MFSHLFLELASLNFGIKHVESYFMTSKDQLRDKAKLSLYAIFLLMGFQITAQPIHFWKEYYEFRFDSTETIGMKDIQVS